MGFYRSGTAHNEPEIDDNQNVELLAYEFDESS